MKKSALIILDGLGLGDGSGGDAFAMANAPYLKSIFKNESISKLRTDGVCVGLPDGQVGGSEVGHITLGSGRVVVQHLTKINNSIEDGSFFRNETLNNFFTKAADKGYIHIIGMISDGGIHSYISHLKGLLEFAKKVGIDSDKVYIHAIADGRDVGERTVKEYLNTVDSYGYGKVVSLSGRFYAMDRDSNWDRTDKYMKVFTSMDDVSSDNGIVQWVDKFYAESNKSDYYIPPVSTRENVNLKLDDSVIFWNFRTDRARQISKKIIEIVGSGNLLAFGDYCDDAVKPFQVEEAVIDKTLGSLVSDLGGKQLRISETEKFNHVTFFFSGETKDEFMGESRILIPSKKCDSFAEIPEMSAREQVIALKDFIRNNNDIDLIVQNFANADLVGHSGDLSATVKAIEVLDECLKDEVKFLVDNGYSLLVTADHGNSDRMVTEKGDPDSSHTKNLVPCVVLGDRSCNLREFGTLADVAPTICELLDVDAPDEMTGSSLIS